MKKKLTVLALAFAMVLTMSASVFATGANAGNTGATDKDYNSSEAKLVKYLQVAEGITLPTETFTFTFTPAASKTSDYAVPAGDFTETSAEIAVSDMSKATGSGDADTNNQIGSKTIAEIFDGYSFPRAGEYTFDVAETVPASAENNVVTTTDTAAGKTTKMTYSSDTYQLHLIVDKDGNIDDVTVQDEGGTKVDATDVDPSNNTGGATTTSSNGGFTFTNKYTKSITKHDEPKNPNPDPVPDDDTNPGDTPKDIDKTDKLSDQGAFELDKYVLGQYGDHTQDFTFTVTVDLPASDKDFTLPDGWVDGTAKDVNLQHEGNFKFAELPMGTKVTVEEADVSGYTKSFTTSQSDNGLIILVGENGGYAICRNDFDDTSITPTGIIINNLPYVLLIGLALGGIVLFSRKRRYE